MTTNNNKDFALQAEEYLNATLGFHIPKAQFYSVNINLFGGVDATLALEDEDIYALLDAPEARGVAGVSDYIAIVSTGWAAPLDADGNPPSVPPSRADGRRRVRLTMFATSDKVMSVIRFEDDPENPVFDPGSATGNLADAIQSLYA